MPFKHIATASSREKKDKRTKVLLERGGLVGKKLRGEGGGKGLSELLNQGGDRGRRERQNSMGKRRHRVKGEGLHPCCKSKGVRGGLGEK